MILFEKEWPIFRREHRSVLEGNLWLVMSSIVAPVNSTIYLIGCVGLVFQAFHVRIGVWTPKHLLRRPLGVPFTPPHKVFDGFWKTRVEWNPSLLGLGWAHLACWTFGGDDFDHFYVWVIATSNLKPHHSKHMLQCNGACRYICT